MLPVRGLVLTRNKKGRAFDLIDIKRWIRVNRDIFKVLKIDVAMPDPDAKTLGILLEQAATLDVRLSLRTDCSQPPVSLTGLGLLDVFLTPATVDAPHLEGWLASCKAANLPIRLQVQPPFSASFDAAAFAARLASTGVAAVNVSRRDAFLVEAKCADAAASRRTVEQMNALVRRIDEKGIEANLIGIPFCLAEKDNYPHVLNALQLCLDHQQYQGTAYEFASKLFLCRPGAAARALVLPLGRNASVTTILDSKILPWILEGAHRHVRLLVWRRLTRQLRVVWGRPRALPEDETTCERELAKYRARQDKEYGPICGQCALRRICDRATRGIFETLPGLTFDPQKGGLVVSTMHFYSSQYKYYDIIESERIKWSEQYLSLAQEAKNIVTNTPPTREIDSNDYEVEGQWTHHMPGGNRWNSFTNSEKLSTILTRTAPPLTVCVTLGGGIAELAGFSFGRHCKLVCPMEAYSHQVALHVNAEGYYVLLRDGKPVRPTEFEGSQLVPNRLPGMLDPRISLWNIDGAIVTQTVLVWEGQTAEAAKSAEVKYSVFIMTTRYARRLQAALLGLAHQREFDPRKLEVIVGYVPGLDATDDVIDSMRLSYPDLRIVRAPFSEGYARSKGFLINESVKLASGEWVILLDSDTIVAPNTFATMEQHAATCAFMAPEGRKMLPPEVTAEILLGNIKPWEQWDALIAGPGEFRLREANGVPIGFFQCVRKECMNKVHYQEMDHFEGADWWFGHDMREVFGHEVRLPNVPALHLDHGGSQWYGTSKHR